MRKAEQRKQFDSRRAVTVDRIPLLFPRFLLFSSLLKIILSATTGKANWESEAEPSSGGQICSGSLFHSDTNFSNNVITRRTGQISRACKFLHVRLNYLSRSVASPFSRDANVEWTCWRRIWNKNKGRGRGGEKKEAEEREEMGGKRGDEKFIVCTARSRDSFIKNIFPYSLSRSLTP